MARTKSIEKEIEELLRTSIEDAKKPLTQLSERLDVLKVAIMWRKAQKDEELDAEGAFFDDENRESNVGEPLQKGMGK